MFRDTAVAQFLPDGSAPLNSDNLNSLATQFANDFLSWIQFTGDQSFVGVAGIVPTGLYDSVVIDYYADNSSKTRVYTPAVMEYGRELGHWDQSLISACTAMILPCLQLYGPPGMCVSGHLQLTRWRICLQDGRLIQTYITGDFVT